MKLTGHLQNFQLRRSPFTRYGTAEVVLGEITVNKSKDISNLTPTFEKMM